MKFRLYYDGPLKSNGGPADKQVLRRKFHIQLQELIRRKPLEAFRKIHATPGSHQSATTIPLEPFKKIHTTPQPHQSATIIVVEKFRFIPLITQKLVHIVSLHITFLSPEEPGGVITQGGDLDNRIKTLLDALRAPKSIAELPKNDSPQPDEDPFYCLLEDDNLINGLSVTVDRLLRPDADTSEVVLLIHVIPEPTYSTIGSINWTVL